MKNGYAVVNTSNQIKRGLLWSCSRN